jgi:hypothetical protein
MILEVPFDQFADAVNQHVERAVVYVCPGGSGTLVTAADPAKAALVVQSSVRASEDDTVAELKEKGLETRKGRWKDQGFSAGQGDLWVVAVAYKSNERKPGLWVTAYETEPSPGEVLSDLYGEFRETGEVHGISLEEFIRLANPNLLILSPDQVQGYAVEKALDRLSDNPAFNREES